jgi:MFS family permease
MPDAIAPQSTRSLPALDALNVFLADVRDGLGPYLAIYLTARRNWSPDRVGVAMAAMLVGTVLAQTPAGALIDRVRWKRWAVTLAAGVVALGCVAMIARPSFPVIIAAQVTVGAAAAVFPPAIGALSLGLVGHRLLARRTGRNEAFNHGGNVASALLAGAVGYFVGYWTIFYLVAAMAAASAASVLLIRERDIDHAVARGAAGGTESPAPEGGVPFDRDLDPMTAAGAGEAGQASIAGIGAVLADRRIVIFVVSAVLFHFANAAMLPLVGQKTTLGLHRGASVLMSACIIAAQVVMVPVALAASRLAESWGRKPVFLIGLAVLPVRGLLYTLGTNPYFLVGVQLLDGIGAGIFGVVSVLVVADLTRGTGRFNLTLGALATATGLGAALSNLLTGYIVGAAGFDAGFLALAAIAGVALAFFAMAMPETRPLPGAVGVSRAEVAAPWPSAVHQAR